MSFFRKIGNAIARFMYGRNGVDQLGMLLMWTCVGVDLVSMFILSRFQTVGSILYWASMALWVWTLFRIFSRNLSRRQAENARWLNFRWRMKSRRSGAKSRRADRDHKYFTCKGCGTVCRVPVGKGKIVITCPKCGAEIEGKS